MKLSLLRVIFVAVPECILMVYVGLGLLGVKTTVKNYLVIGVVGAGSLWFIDNLLNLYGLHSILSIIILGVLINIVVDVEIKQSIIVILIGMIILAIGDLIFVTLIVKISNLNVGLIGEQDYLYLLCMYLGMIPLLITAYSIYRFDITLIKLAGDRDEVI